VTSGADALVMKNKNKQGGRGIMQMMIAVEFCLEEVALMCFDLHHQQN